MKLRITAMQKRNRTHALALGLAAALTAALFTSPALSAPIEWVTVGSPNATKDDTGYGAVGYEYRISKYETTNAQYVEFLNAVASKEDLYGLYNFRMSLVTLGGIERQGAPGSYTYSSKAGMDNKPVNYVSFYDTLRFANWLNNGKGAGDTETGAYTLAGGNPVGVVRNSGANVFLPTEDEWFKAAYYDAATMTFFDFPAGTDAQLTCSDPGATANSANCGGALLQNVGSYTGSASPYGTFDQGGNVTEWIFGGSRVIRGGAYFSLPNNVLGKNFYTQEAPASEQVYLGFRLGTHVVPEPGTAVLLMAGLLGISGWRQMAGAAAERP